MDKLISIIIITYNHSSSIERCLASVKNQEGVKAELIVIDNASSDSTSAKVKNYNPDYLIERKTNSGFAKAANEGVKLSQTDYLLFLNPDAELKEQAIQNLVNELEKDNKIAMVGGKFISNEGKPMVSFGNFPSFRTEIVQKLKLHKLFPWARYITPSLFSRNLFNKIHAVDWVSGGFCLVRKKTFQEIGGFDENYFVYLEDVDLAKRFKQRGYQINFSPNAVAIHHQRKRASELEKKYEKESLDYYRRKFK